MISCRNKTAGRVPSHTPPTPRPYVNYLGTLGPGRAQKDMCKGERIRTRISLLASVRFCGLGPVGRAGGWKLTLLYLILP